MQEMRNGTKMPPFLVFPRFLLKMDLSDTAKLVYILLLNRAKVSMKNGSWTNSEGYVYVHYTIRTMAEDIRRSETTVKNAYGDLEKAGLIRRERQGKNHPNRIYVRMPGQTKNCPQEGQNAVHQGAKNCLEIRMVIANQIQLGICNVTDSEAYKRVVAWCHLFQEAGYAGINHERTLSQAWNLLPETKEIAEILGREPLAEILRRTYMDVRRTEILSQKLSL